MSSISQFFGGSANASADATNFKNIKYLNNTEFSVPNINRGYAPRPIPNTDNTFFLLEGNSTSDIYASYWSISGDGSCTQLGSAVQLAGSNEVANGAAANGIDTLIVAGGNNYDTIYSVTWSGSSLTSTSRRSVGQPVQNMCSAGCLSDGTLFGTVGENGSGSQQYVFPAFILPDGTVLNTGSHATGIVGGNGGGRIMGHDNAVFFLGPHYNNNTYWKSGILYLGVANNSTLQQVYSNTHDFQFSQGIASGIINFNTYMAPDKGRMRGYFLDNNYRLFEVDISTYDGRMMYDVSGVQPSSATFSVNNNYSALSGYFGQGAGYSRQANGTWIAFQGGGNSSNTVYFDSSPAGYRTPFAHLSIRADAQTTGVSSGTSDCVVGNYVVRTFYSENQTEVNINVWSFKG